MLAPAGLTLGLCLAASALMPEAAHASEGLSGQAMELFTAFLEKVESMGPLGAVVFVGVVMLCEMVPLFPTQPLSLASGLLFGPQKGALLMLLAVTLAACNSFFISRGVGRPLAQKIIDAEMGHGQKGGVSGTMAKTMARVEAAIDGGGFWKQTGAVALLRLTPVVPYSASNYILGLTPVQFPALLVGTVPIMAIWSVIYAGLGGASRKLLDRGVDVEVLFTDLIEKAAGLSTSPVGVAGGLIGMGGLAYAIYYFTRPSAEDEAAQGGSQGSPLEGNVLGSMDEAMHTVPVPCPPAHGAGEHEAVGRGIARASPHRSGKD